MGRRPRGPPAVDTTNDTPFRSEERYWKNKREERDWSRALTVSAIEWDPRCSPSGKQRGTWQDDGHILECWRVPMDDLAAAQIGQTRWKGKAKSDEPIDFAIVVPAIPGLVLLPRILPPELQRSLTIESLRSSLSPNVTSLAAHYELPEEGIWNAWECGKRDLEVERKDKVRETVLKREQNNFEPVTKENWNQLKDRGKDLEHKSATDPSSSRSSSAAPEQCDRRDVTVAELLPKLRWTTIGWTYDWTSKTYDFDSPRVPLPPLMYDCCKAAVRAVPWNDVFAGEPRLCESEGGIDNFWTSWHSDYEPEAGIINFYHLQDSLTAHVDQSEVDAIRPLISFSLGHSAIFLVGGPTRDTKPLAIRLDSGDGLIMSGRSGRRVFHGLPRVIAGTLPPHLGSESNELSQHEDADEWRTFGQYLEGGARININVRTVF
ncbi:hypothetical protein OIO90_000643 [Microbotryomycetes sp. JL221]|nr:hypothetical protein OIO90_000643 [Microbotryomycetes sp. JL221]